MNPYPLAAALGLAVGVLISLRIPAYYGESLGDYIVRAFRTLLGM